MSDAFIVRKGGSGGGDADLNFSLVGGTSQPAGSENMIWVNTSETITDFVFSATEPSSPSEGLVWILTGTTSSVAFNALKKDSIMVYPVSCRQYISGAWVSKEAKSYVGGAWKSWVSTVYLYKDGTLNTSLGEIVSASNDYPATVLNYDNLLIVFGDTTYGVAMSKNKIDVTGLNKLIVETPSPSAMAHFGIASAKPSYWPSPPYNSGSIIAQKAMSASANSTTLDFSSYDLSQYSNQVYLFLCGDSEFADAFTASEIRLEA